MRTFWKYFPIFERLIPTLLNLFDLVERSWNAVFGTADTSCSGWTQVAVEELGRHYCLEFDDRVAGVRMEPGMRVILEKKCATCAGEGASCRKEEQA